MIVTTNIDAAYIGTTRVLKMYLGSNLVWPQEEPPTTYDYLCLTSDEDGSTVTLTNYNSSTISVNCEYSYNKSTWTTFDYDDTVTLDAGEKIYLRGTNSSGWSSAYNAYTYFELDGSIYASGTIMSLIDGTGETTTIPGGTFARLFSGPSGQTALKSFPKLTATTLVQNCYNGMFNGCSNATGSVELPATTIPAYAYHSTFRGTGLTAITFPSTGIYVSGTQALYHTCHSTNITELDISFTNAALAFSSSLAYICSGCSDLTNVYLRSSNSSVSMIPVSTNNVFQLAFQNCTSLTYIRSELTDNTSSTKGFYNWLSGASSSGDIYVYSSATMASGVSGIPSGWTKHTI